MKLSGLRIRRHHGVKLRECRLLLFLLSISHTLAPALTAIARTPTPNFTRAISERAQVLYYDPPIFRTIVSRLVRPKVRGGGRGYYNEPHTSH